jgi:hypothetical protein
MFLVLQVLGAGQQQVYLAGGVKALRIEFPAPSPLGLLGPHRA